MMTYAMRCLLLLCLLAVSLALRATPPHIVILFCDNVGWANLGYHRPPLADAREFNTPNIDHLAATGLQLDSHYTYKYCSPSRSSILTGRLPVHVNIYNDDPAMPDAGVPLNFTMLPALLSKAGYRSHMVGKWHVGMASHDRTPHGRGFASSLHYFHSENNYYDQTRTRGCGNRKYVDLYDTDAPAYSLNGTGYEEDLFGDRVLSLIKAHPVKYPHVPMFMYYAMHTSCVGDNGTHGGQAKLEPPQEWWDRLSFIDDHDRRANMAMVAHMDDIVGEILAELRRNGMWNDTILLWASDNGGAVHLGGGANSWPKRGGYYSNWQGGIVTPAVLNGGALFEDEANDVAASNWRPLPPSLRGAHVDGWLHEADWYATFAALAGLDPTDHAAAAAGLPPVDSLDMWGVLRGEVKDSPRHEWSVTPMGEDVHRSPHGGDATYIEYPYKLIVGHIAQASWCGQVHPNTTRPWNSFADILDCTVRNVSSDTTKVGCLFDVIRDPNEHDDLSLTMPSVAERLYGKMKAAEAHWYNPDRGHPQEAACEAAARRGYWQPWLEHG